MKLENWEMLSKKAYWDRDVPLDRWRKMVAIGHRSYLPGAISAMTPVEFVRFYGLPNFRRDWPTLRAKLPAETAKSLGLQYPQSPRPCRAANSNRKNSGSGSARRRGCTG